MKCVSWKHAETTKLSLALGYFSSDLAQEARRTSTPQAEIPNTAPERRAGLPDHRQTQARELKCVGVRRSCIP
jgi:hypothetical protein